MTIQVFWDVMTLRLACLTDVSKDVCIFKHSVNIMLCWPYISI